MLELLLVTLFWPILAVLFVAISFSSDEDKPGWATLMFAGTLALVHYGGGVNLLHLVRDHAPWVGMSLTVYVAFGVVYHLIRWKYFCEAVCHSYADIKDEFLRSRKLSTEGGMYARIPDDHKQLWTQYLNSHYLNTKIPQQSISNGEFVKPDRRNNKTRLMTWLAYWPTSALWWLLNDRVMGIFRHIYRSLGTTYDKISDKAFAGIDQDFRVVTPPSPPAAPNSDDGEDEDLFGDAGVPGDNDAAAKVLLDRLNKNDRVR